MNAVVTIKEDGKPDEDWLRINIVELKKYHCGNLLNETVLVDEDSYYIPPKKFANFLDCVCGANVEVRMDWIANNTESTIMFVHPQHWFKTLRHYDKKRD